MVETGYVIWFYGLPCAGKSTLGFELTNRLAKRSIKVEHLDGDVVRKTLCKDLGFSSEDRFTNIQRISFVAERLIDNGIFAVCSFITPTIQMRLYLRSIFRNRLILVWCDAPLLTCMDRDNKGMYKRAMVGDIKEFTGITAPFDKTTEHDLGLDIGFKKYQTGIGGQKNIDSIVDDIIEYLEEEEII